MTSAKTCKIRLLNKTYEIKCPEEEANNLKNAAKKLNEQLLTNKTKCKSLNEFQLLLLASLNISHELVACQKQQAEQRHHVNELISALGNKMNDTLPTKSSVVLEAE